MFTRSQSTIFRAVHSLQFITVPLGQIKALQFPGKFHFLVKTLYGRLFKYNYVGWLLFLIFSTDLLFAIKRDACIFKETEDFVGFSVKFGQTCLPIFCSHRPLVELLMLRKPTNSSCFLEDIGVPFDCKQQISTKH